MKSLIMALVSLVVFQEADSTAVGGWNLRTIKDPISDAIRGIANTSRENDINMVVKCDDNGSGEVYFSLIATDYVGEGRYGYRDFTYRIDSAPARTLTASHDNHDASVFDLNPGTAGGNFMKELSTASRLTVRITTHDFRQITGVIDVTNAKDAFKYVGMKCMDTKFLEQFD